MSDMVKRLKRNPERWAAMNMTAVMEGSPAQALFALEDAKADIATLAAELSRLSALVAWQDIETAPKDGDELLFCLPRQQGVRLLARWDRIYRVWRKKGEAIYFHPGDLWVRLPAPPVSQLKDTTNADK